MNTYRLVFSEDSHGEAKVVEFDAEDAAEALTIAHSESPRRNAELWREERMLCTIRRNETGYWQVKQSGAHPVHAGVGAS